MVVDRNGVKYVKIGHTEFLLSDVKGKTLKKLQERYSYLHPKVVLNLSLEVSPKKIEKPIKEEKVKKSFED